jgi:hypothetical protein
MRKVCGLFEGPKGLEQMFGGPIQVDWEDPSLDSRSYWIPSPRLSETAMPVGRIVGS